MTVKLKLQQDEDKQYSNGYCPMESEIVEIRQDVKHIRESFSLLPSSIDRLTQAIQDFEADFKTTFKEAIPHKMVFLLFLLVFLLIAGLEGLKDIFGALKALN